MNALRSFAAMSEKAGESIWDARAELFASLAGVLGWVFLTAAVAELLPARVVWLASAGLFLLTMFGWSFLLEIGRKGLYALTRAKR